MTAHSELVSRLGLVLKEHNRLASWNREKGRFERVAFHHDAVLTIRDAIKLLQTPPPATSVSTGMETLQASECTKHGEGDQ